jgi:DNA replication and repair protein RecF
VRPAISSAAAAASAPPAAALARQTWRDHVSPGRGGCWLARLALSEFRCYQAAELQVDRRPVVLAGANGAGKTNLLEAISFLAPGRGLRGARLSDVDRRRPGAAVGAAAGAGWSVAAQVMTPEGPRDLGTGRQGEPAAAPESGEGRERRIVKIDGGYARGQQALAGVVRMVWLTPRMDGLFRDGPSGRRRFLDRLVAGFDAGHSGRAAAYDQAMRQRTRLLKAGGRDAAWLAALEDTMARHGVAIEAARRGFVAALSRACAAAQGPFPRARLELEGEVSARLADGPALAAEDEMRARLGAARRQDAESGGAAVGPHRSDLAVSEVESGRPAGEGSTGEQKALLLSIVLSHARLLAAERGATPLVLLDEVAAHLDPRRRRALFEEILALGAQAWLTGTEAALFAELGEAAQVFAVDSGRVAPLTS